MKARLSEPLVSEHFPYIPVRVSIPGLEKSVEALLDTGFDGDIIVPESFLGQRYDETADDYLPWSLADDSIIYAPAYRGWLEIGEVGAGPAVVSVLGEKAIVGRNAILVFRVILDKGKRVIVE